MAAPASPYQRTAIRAAKQAGVPTKIFLRLVNQESGWNPKAVSPVGAQGLTQLMPATAKSLGVTNAFDPKQALDGGARYLRQQLDRFGSVKLALAAYNAGPGNVSSGEWQRIPETVRYVNSILGPQSSDSISPSGGVQNEHTQAPKGTTGNPLDIFGGDQLSQAAFEGLGKIAQGWKPTTTLKALAETAQNLTPSEDGSSSSSTSSGTSDASPPPKKQNFPANGQPIPSADLTSVGAEHPTSGLPGFPAKDYFAAAGAPVTAPVSGTIVRLSGHNPAQGPTSGVHGPFGWSIYLKGSDGHTYFLTHLGSRSVTQGQKVSAGTQIGTVGDYAKYGGANHVHMGVSS